MKSILELVSTVSFGVLCITMLVALSFDGPVEFDIVGKLLLVLLVGSMLGTIIPLIIAKSREI